jgi:hypothetical protein
VRIYRAMTRAMTRALLSLLLFSLAAVPGVFADDNPADYTATLIPLVSHGLPGAHGSVWNSELHIYNASHLLLRMLGAIEDAPILSLDPAVFIDPNELREVVLNPREPGVDGALLYVPNAMVDSTKMALRVRDTSQNATSLGDEVPVVRADQAKHDLTVVDVPVDPKYRATLRIYGFTAAPMPVRATVYSESGTQLAQFDVELNGILTAVFVPFPPHPAYIALDPLTPAVRAAGGRRVRIDVTNFGTEVTPPPARIWAFVSLTNNETNQVTLVTPK